MTKACLFGALLVGCVSVEEPDPTTPTDSPADTPSDPGGIDSPAEPQPSVDGEPPPGDPARCALGASVFDETRIHTLELTLSGDDWRAMVREAEDSPEYGGPDKTYFNADARFDGSPLPSPLAVRLKGHSSLLAAAARGHAYPLKVDLNRVDDDQTLDGLRKINLHPNLDGISVLNEFLSYGAMRAADLPTARVGFARVTVNGEALGLYSVVEQLGGDFVRCHFGAPHGDLYKPEEPVGNLAWRGDGIDDYEPEIQFRWPDDSVTDHQSLLTLLDVINADGVEDFAAVLDVPQVLRYLSANVAVGNYDYYASFGHNYYLYEATPGRFRMLPWDMNYSQTLLDSPCGLGRNDEDWPISHKLLGDETQLSAYLDALVEWLEGEASVERLHGRLDDVLTVLGDELDEGRVDELRETIRDRVEAQLAAIDAGVAECPVWE